MKDATERQSTSQLQSDLSSRQGVETIRVSPYETVTITTSLSGTTIRRTGPAIITINRD